MPTLQQIAAHMVPNASLGPCHIAGSHGRDSYRRWVLGGGAERAERQLAEDAEHRACARAQRLWLRVHPGTFPPEVLMLELYPAPSGRRGLVLAECWAAWDALGVRVDADAEADR